MSTYHELWGDHWRAQVERAISRQGHSDIHRYLMVHPTETYVALASKLGKGIAPLQLQILQAESPKSREESLAAASDCTIRKMTQHLPQGWGKGSESDFRAASMFQQWMEFVHFLMFKPKNTDAVWKELKLTAPLGWRPRTLNDPYLQALLTKYFINTINPCSNTTSAE